MGEVNVETKSGKGRRNSGTDYSCSEFHGGFNGAKTGFLSPIVWEIFVIEIGKFRIRPQSKKTIYVVVKFIQFWVLRYFLSHDMPDQR